MKDDSNEIFKRGDYFAISPTNMVGENGYYAEKLVDFGHLQLLEVETIVK